MYIVGRCLSYNLVQVAVHSLSELLSSIFFLSNFTGSSVRMLPLALLFCLSSIFEFQGLQAKGKKAIVAGT